MRRPLFILQSPLPSQPSMPPPAPPDTSPDPRAPAFCLKPIIKNTHQPDREQAGAGQSGNGCNLPVALSCRLLGKKQVSRQPELPPLLPEGNRFADNHHPPWGGLKICQFAFLRKVRSLPRSTLCSSLPPLHKKFACASGKPLSPRRMAQKPYCSTNRKGSIIMVVAEYINPSGTAYRLIKEGSRIIAERQIKRSMGRSRFLQRRNRNRKNRWLYGKSQPLQATLVHQATTKNPRKPKTQLTPNSRPANPRPVQQIPAAIKQRRHNPRAQTIHPRQ